MGSKWNFEKNSTRGILGLFGSSGTRRLQNRSFRHFRHSNGTLPFGEQQFLKRKFEVSCQITAFAYFLMQSDRCMVGFEVMKKFWFFVKMCLLVRRVLTASFHFCAHGPSEELVSSKRISVVNDSTWKQDFSAIRARSVANQWLNSFISKQWKAGRCSSQPKTSFLLQGCTVAYRWNVKSIKLIFSTCGLTRVSTMLINESFGWKSRNPRNIAFHNGWFHGLCPFPNEAYCSFCHCELNLLELKMQFERCNQQQ